MLKGTFDGSTRMKVTIHSTDVPDLEKHCKLAGTLQRTYNSDKPTVEIKLLIEKINTMYIEASPRPSYATKYYVHMSNDDLEKVRQGHIVSKEFPLSTGVTYFQLSLEGVVQETASPQPPPQ